MLARRVGATLAAATLTTIFAAGLSAPASAAAPAPVAATDAAVQVSGQFSGRDPFPRQSPKKIQAKAVAAAKAAKTVHVRSYVNDGDEITKMDVVLARTAGQARLVMSKSGTLTIVRYGKDLYMAGDVKFWVNALKGDEDMAKIAPKLAGKWIKITGDSADLKDLRDFVTIGYWVSDLAAFHATKRVAGKVISRIPTVGLIDQPGKDGSVLYVAAKGAPYPLYMETNDKTASITYSGWNKPVKIVRPRAIMTIPANVF